MPSPQLARRLKNEKEEIAISSLPLRLGGKP
jgi:hypothetical protein